ncbi:MAG: hypothetical protein ACLFTR_00115 [Candidatus Woesearchaeota archaeon]
MQNLDTDDMTLVMSQIPNRMFLLQCPSCGKTMRYKENLNNPRKNSDIGRKKKRCVFCGNNFKVRECIVKSLSD